MTWSKRYPWIVESALKNRYKQFIIDGEAVVLGVDGISDFSALHSGKNNDEVQLYAFDILALDGDDLRHLPLSMRKAHLSSTPAGRHLRRAVRAGRDRTKSLLRRLQYGPGRAGVEAPGIGIISRGARRSGSK